MNKSAAEIMAKDCKNDPILAKALSDYAQMIVSKEISQMNKYQHFACSQIFHSYPYYLSFENIKDLCLNDAQREEFNKHLGDDFEDSQLQLCEYYENQRWSNIPLLLDELCDLATNFFSVI